MISALPMHYPYILTVAGSYFLWTMMFLDLETGDAIPEVCICLLKSLVWIIREAILIF